MATSFTTGQPQTNEPLGPNANGPRPISDSLFYIFAAALGMLAGWADIQVGDLLFTALLVLGPCILMGALRPARAWRWTIIVGLFVPLADLMAYLFLAQRLNRAQVYESFLAFLPALVGAYGGAFMREVINNVLDKQ
jgi:hypothetical protein